MLQNDDIFYIRRTFTLARKALGETSPNPLVGAVLVKKNRIIGEGFHARAGLAHAEINAFAAAKESAANATLYCNLEPCTHTGRTPPCVPEIIRRKISRVVIATVDPNPQVSGKGIRALTQAGITVTCGICETQARQLNEVFFKTMEQKTPFIAAKWAQSLDGKIATAGGNSHWITHKAARAHARALRDRYDAVCVGVGTVISDNPQLNGLRKIPLKIVLDPHLRTPLDSRVITETPDKTIIITQPGRRALLKPFPAKIRIHTVPVRRGIFDCAALLQTLYTREGVQSIFVEGGSTTLGSFFDARAVDKMYAFIAPTLIGGTDSLGALGGKGVARPRSISLTHMRIRRIQTDMLIEGYPSYERT